MAKRFRIGIDARMIRHSGIGTYLENLLKEISRLDSGHFEIVLFGDPGRLSFLKGFGPVRNFSPPIYSLSEQIGFLSAVSSVDLWHAPHYNVPLAGSGRLVVTVHDLIPFIYAGRFFSRVQKLYFTLMLKSIARRARRLIAVSENTRADLIRLFNLAPDRIRVIHEGVSDDFKPVSDEAVRENFRRHYSLNPQDTYLLYVGLLKPHKNLERLIRTVKKLRHEHELRDKLLIVGKKDARYSREARYLAGIQTDGDVVYIPGVERPEMPVLYSLANVLILPSLYEGFGLPVLEAMACGTPVIASNRASLPEVAGDAAVFFDAESDESLREAVLKLTRNRRLRENFQARGLDWVRQFSWSRMARETLQVYEEASGGL